MATAANPPAVLSEHTTLGRTALSVARLGIGAGYGAPPHAYEKAFHEYNVNYFYWSLPRRGGMKRAIENLKPNHRDDLVIAVQTYDHFGFLLETFFERQLKTLAIDRADVLLLGWFNRYPPNRVMDAALKLRDQGKARYIAMSGHNRPAFGEIAQMPNSPIDIFMIRYNAAHRGAETDIFPHLPAENRPGIITYTTTSWGKLLNPKKMPPGEDPMTSTDCYRFALSNPNVDMCLCGPKNAAEMDAALATLDSPPMNDQELERARKIGDYVHG